MWGIYMTHRRDYEKFICIGIAATLTQRRSIPVALQKIIGGPDGEGTVSMWS